jgi:hypothetical protein
MFSLIKTARFIHSRFLSVNKFSAHAAEHDLPSIQSGKDGGGNAARLRHSPRPPLANNSTVHPKKEVKATDFTDFTDRKKDMTDPRKKVTVFTLTPILQHF